MTIRDLIDPANVPNLQIHQIAGLKKDGFLERVKSVRAIRRSAVTLDLTWYPTTAREWTLWEGIHNAVNKGEFGNVGVREGYYPFGLILPRSLHNLFERNDLAVIQRQVVAYLATVLAYDPEGEKFIQDQIFPPVAKMAQQARAELYPEPINQNRFWEDFLPEVDEAFTTYSGAPAFEFLRFPPYSHRPNDVTNRWWIDSEFHLGYGLYYFTGTDWKTLIVEKGKDALLRCESDKDTWELWLHAFKLGELNQGCEASFFVAPATRGTIYVIRQEGSDHYKIGWTTAEDPVARLGSLQTGSPKKLELIGHFSAASQSSERAVHRLFSNHRASGEWFILTEQQVINILDPTWRRSQQIN